MMDRPTLAWLRNAKTPSIAYPALREFSPRGSAGAIRAARRSLTVTGPVPAILSRQGASGRWKIDRGYYGPKYFSTHWSMTLLAELGADRRCGGFRRGAEYMLGVTASETSLRLRSDQSDWACFYGNLLRYSLQAGFTDARVETVVDLLTQSVAEDLCACRSQSGRPCAWGVVRALGGLAAVPPADRSRRVKAAVGRGIRFLLAEHRLERAAYPVSKREKNSPLWFRLNFPLFYQVDLLFALRVVADCDALDHRGARAALDWLAGQRRPDGRWKGASPFRTRTWREMGEPAETDRWVTLQALRILKQAGRLA
jgi:hypothetical protein